MKLPHDVARSTFLLRRPKVDDRFELRAIQSSTMSHFVMGRNKIL